MATPQDLTTTVNGRRCTRSRARKAATSSIISSAPPPPAPASTSPLTTSTTSTTTSQAVQQIQTSAADPPPPASPSTAPSSTPPAQQAPQTQAISSTLGTNSEISQSTPQSAPSPANVPPPPASDPQVSAAAKPTDAPEPTVSPEPTTASKPAAAVVPNPNLALASSAAPESSVASVPSQAPEPSVVSAASEPSVPQQTTAAAAADTKPTPPPPALPASTSSDTLPAVATTTTPSSLPDTQPLATSSAQVSSVSAVPDLTTSSPDANPSETSVTGRPASPQSTDAGISTGGQAGAITPGQGPTSPEEQGLTLPGGTQTNVAQIAGGVVGGVVGLALISTLLFYCLRRQRTGRLEKLQQRMSEKRDGDEGFFSRIAERVKEIPANIGIVFAKLKGKKAGPTSNPYRRHTVRSSVSSVYSVQNHGRNLSNNDAPPTGLQKQLRAFGSRMPSLKRSKSLLHKKQDSLVVGNKSPFIGIVEDPVQRNSKNGDQMNTTVEQPKNLFVMNPDRQTRDDLGKGLQDQQRGPLTPAPVATSERSSKDPFASILDELEQRDGSGTPEWLRDNAQKHKRTTSAQTALRSHPPSSYATSMYSDVENPFFDPSDAPPVPSQPLPPNPPVRPTNTYAPFPAFNATSSTISRDSDMSLMLSRAGPSRPGTNTFGSKVRQSDPFDLDRPEVLSFGTVGGRSVRASTVTRQSTRTRASSVPNWTNGNEGPYNTQKKEASVKR